MRGSGSTQAYHQYIPAFWTSLFLIAPVISTTFASVGRMLAPLPPESLGWLLIDEAGQAPPQQAVGALLRSRKAVVVGDPLQVQPVVTLSPTLVKKIAGAYGVDPDRWTAVDASVQTLADKAGPYAAAFDQGDVVIEVGAPLVVHRRCDEPMFGISNQVSYGGFMVPQVASKASQLMDILGPSHWLDIQGSGTSKWCRDEGFAVLNMLEQLSNANVREPDLFVISPFRMVAQQMRSMVEENPSHLRKLTATDAHTWVSQQIGTVHTFQGREAEAVILLLGAPNADQNGARAWAGSPPNIVNVAVTRAKRALYVVGNRDLWKGYGAFQTLDRELS